jgi:hypothetical protein
MQQSLMARSRLGEDFEFRSKFSSAEPSESATEYVLVVESDSVLSSDSSAEASSGVEELAVARFISVKIGSSTRTEWEGGTSLRRKDKAPILIASAAVARRASSFVA